MKIPFTKAHGAKNDFLLTWRRDAPATGHADLARAICDRHTGIGADGWILVDPPAGSETHGAIQLYNSDGSMAEISGNGTRCAAAFLLRHGYAPKHADDLVRIRTGAGIKTLRLLATQGAAATFEMNMGRAEIRDLHFELPLSTGPRDVTILWVGNPQCIMPVENFDFDWRALGAEIATHPHFPNQTNVSFFKPVDRHAIVDNHTSVDNHTIDVRFFERGAGETMSSGTGSTGAAATAIARGLATSPVRVLTPAGPIDLRLEGDIYLTGPTEIVAEGAFFGV
jgi:diaminopimelate epimerase